MRCDQLMGLNEWAREFVRGERVFVYTEVVTRVYPDGRIEVLGPCKVYKSSVLEGVSGEFFEGIGGKKHLLHMYTFPGGSVYYERVQRKVLSSGPVFFLALQDEKGDWVQESLWPEEVIEAA